ncbi:MAG: hypothetical protein J6N21_22300 [Butyrivibrio sp.]|nr:hypothetical protein [Butyrivibrio sp.]
MNEDQYRRANSNSFYVCLVIIGCGCVLAINKLLQGNINAGSISVIIAGIVGCSMIAVGNFKYPTVKMGSILIMGGSTIFYFVLLIASDNIVYFAFGLPILICSINYLNIRLCKVGIFAIINSFIITVIRSFITTGEISILYAPAFITLALAFVACLATVSLLTKFNEENNETITKNAEKTLESGKQMADIANSITTLFNDSQSDMSELQNIIEKQNSGMRNIATSMESTAHAITKQAERVQQIQEETEATEQHRKDMMKASENAQQAVHEGVRVIEDLKNKSQNVAMQSQVTVDATKAVIDKVAEVTKIVGSIMSISKQTNLLALNASIEAARAGEAGKGFAVVANDVRELAEETNTASTEITGIINELNEDVQKAMSSIDDTVASVSEQNAMISSVGENFDSINDNVTEMLSRFSEIGEGMKSIAASTLEINDSISNLSATSEEVASLSNEGANYSEKAVSRFDSFKSILENIFQQANKLRDMQNK